MWRRRWLTTTRWVVQYEAAHPNQPAGTGGVEICDSETRRFPSTDDPTSSVQVALSERLGGAGVPLMVARDPGRSCADR